MFSLRRTLGTASVRRTFSTSIARHDAAKITLLGRLAAEPEITSTSTGKEIVRYVIGVSPGIDKPPVWYRITSFEPSERDKAYLASMPKGTLVLAEGDASLRYYEGEDGKKRLDFSVIHRSIAVIFRPKPKVPVEEQ